MRLKQAVKLLVIIAAVAIVYAVFIKSGGDDEDGPAAFAHTDDISAAKSKKAIHTGNSIGGNMHSVDKGNKAGKGSKGSRSGNKGKGTGNTGSNGSKGSSGVVKDGKKPNGAYTYVTNHDELRGKPDSKHMHGAMVGVKDSATPGFTLVPYVSMAEETLEMKRIAHTQNCFNLKRSDGIALDRDIPDYRDSKCAALVKSYGKDLPATSVIFVFFNEPLSPLYRSIHSVLNRTPPHLLTEIVLIDDGSDQPWLMEELEDYIALLPKTRLIRMPERLGLMAARALGAEKAVGETITFLDAHIEVMDGWLEPMMARIKEDRTHVVMPIIDSIEADSFEYHRGGLDILGFSWALGQKGIGSRRRTRTEPMPSPIMAGGLFSMDRKYFWDLGGYDPEMRLYGGEEMEISFRIWQCGGTLECIPCSRVGHVFRTGKYWKGQVYTVPGDVIVRNKLRAAEVWMDEYKDIVKRVMSPLPPGKGLGDLSAMQSIRKKFNCKPFSWFLENVYPELFVPFDPKYVLASGEIRNPATNACFDTLGARRQGASIGAYPCHHAHGTQEFVMSKKGEIRVAAMDFDNCLDRGNGDHTIGVWPCHQTGGNQAWRWEKSNGRLSDESGKLCAEVIREPSTNSPFTLKVNECDLSNENQEWVIEEAKSA